MSLHLDNLSWFRENQSFFLLLQCSILGGEAANTNFKVVCFTQTVLDPMIYHTRGEPTNYHTIDLLIMHITEIHRTVDWCPFASWVNKSCRINSPVIYWGSYCLIFSILCSIASTIVRLFYDFTYDHYIVCPSSNYDFCPEYFYGFCPEYPFDMFHLA